jgi:hypothetical protein
VSTFPARDSPLKVATEVFESVLRVAVPERVGVRPRLAPVPTVVAIEVGELKAAVFP